MTHDGAASLALATAALRRGQYAQVEHIARERLAKDAADGVALVLLGTALAAQADYPAARLALDAALALRPDDAYAHSTLGTVRAATGDPGGAVACYRHALVLHPQLREAWPALGIGLARLGDGAGALAAARQALALDPGAAPLTLDVGNALQQSGLLAEAIECFTMAWQQAPAFADAAYNLANSLAAAGYFGQAVARYRDALRLRPDERGTLLNLARTLAALGELEQSAALYARLLEKAPDDAVALNNLAGVCAAQGKPELAERYYRQALGLAPRYAACWSNLGNLLHASRRFDEAIAAYGLARALDPSSSEFTRNLALAELTCGDYDSGWRHFEARLEPDPAAIHGARPDGVAWNGDTAQALPLVLLSEAGLGDTIQFLRYGRWFNEHGVRPILQCQPSLVALASTCPYFSHVVSRTDPAALGPHAFCPLMSLPRHVHPSAGALEMDTPYLGVDPVRRARWRDVLASYPGFRVAIAWAGNPDAERHGLRGRSVPLSEFAPLAAIESVQLICLQKGHGHEQLAQVGFRDRVVDLSLVADPGDDAFLDCAAILDCADLLITSDTAIAHLAGALGVPVWVALHRSADWRWGREGSASAWYPTMRLYRQATPGDWEAVFAAIAADLRASAVPRTGDT